MSKALSGMQCAQVVHEPWDDGTIEAAMRSIFPARVCDATQRKTTKTKCGKRVPFDAARHGKVTCADCLKVNEEEERGRRLIEEHMSKLREQGIID